MIQPRSVIGVPEPPVSRRKLSMVRWLLVHYPGVATTSRFVDPQRELSDAKLTAAYGASIRNPYEYNYLVGLGGAVFEQAGHFVGGHCLNFNPYSVGVMLGNAIGVPASDAQARSLAGLRADLVAAGVLHPDHLVVPHYRFRSTSCCGDALADPQGAKNWISPTGEGRMGEVDVRLRGDWAPMPVPPPSPAPVDVDVPTPTLRLGSSGQEAWELIVVLKFWAWYPAQWMAEPDDGKIGARSVEGIKTMQRALKCRADGVYGPVTAKALRAFFVWMESL